MKIGELAKATGLPTKTIRYYESIGLITSALRDDNGYRVYGADDVSTLSFIHRSRDMGFSLKQVADLLSLWQDRSRSSAEVKAIAKDHIHFIDKKIQELEVLKSSLDALAKKCRGDEHPDCPILDELASEEPQKVWNQDF